MELIKNKAIIISLKQTIDNMERYHYHHHHYHHYHHYQKGQG
jgi:hypothetical protein